MGELRASLAAFAALNRLSLPPLRENRNLQTKRGPKRQNLYPVEMYRNMSPHYQVCILRSNQEICPHLIYIYQPIIGIHQPSEHLTSCFLSKLFFIQIKNGLFWCIISLHLTSIFKTGCWQALAQPFGRATELGRKASPGGIAWASKSDTAQRCAARHSSVLP